VEVGVAWLVDEGLIKEVIDFKQVQDEVTKIKAAANPR